MLVTLSGIVMLVSFLQPENAYSPMLVTLLGMMTLVRLEQPENAERPMLVTGNPLYIAGITISLSLHVPIPITEYDLPSLFKVNSRP